MAYFEELDTILNTSVSKLLANQNICKLLQYYPKTIDYQYNPLSEPNINNTHTLLMTNIFPLPKIPDATLEQKCFVNVTLDGGRPMSDNQGFRKVLIVFEIICHLDAWIVKNGYRIFKIASEIDKIFNNRLTDLPIENKPFYLPFNSKAYSDKYYGVQLIYELQVNSNVECGIKNV